MGWCETREGSSFWTRVYINHCGLFCDHFGSTSWPCCVPIQTPLGHTLPSLPLDYNSGRESIRYFSFVLSHCRGIKPRENSLVVSFLRLQLSWASSNTKCNLDSDHYLDCSFSGVSVKFHSPSHEMDWGLWLYNFCCIQKKSTTWGLWSVSEGQPLHLSLETKLRHFFDSHSESSLDCLVLTEAEHCRACSLSQLLLVLWPTILHPIVVQHLQIILNQFLDALPSTLGYTVF